MYKIHRTFRNVFFSLLFIMSMHRNPRGSVYLCTLRIHLPMSQGKKAIHEKDRVTFFFFEGAIGRQWDDDPEKKRDTMRPGWDVMLLLRPLVFFLSRPRSVSAFFPALGVRRAGLRRRIRNDELTRKSLHKTL